MARLAWHGTAMVLIWGMISAPVEAASFQPLGDLPGGDFYSLAYGVSADGSVVVGTGSKANYYTEAFRWTRPGGLQPLGYLPDATPSSEAYAISSDGSVVAGRSISGSSGGAFRWTPEGMEPLGDLPPGGFDRPSTAMGASADGGVIVGTGNYSAGGGPMPVTGEAFYWTRSGGLTPLGDVPGGNGVSRAYDVSADGSVIVGKGDAQASFQVEDLGVAFRWTSQEGMVSLGFLPDGSTSSAATAVSADGSVIVGYSHSPVGGEAFRWTAAEGMTGIGHLNLVPHWNESHANGVSADGSVIVGGSDGAAYLWTADGAMRSLQEVLAQDFGLDLAGWTLQEAADVSDDGNTIVGWGQNPAGQIEAWRAHVPSIDKIGVADPAAGELGSLQRPFAFSGGTRSLSVDVTYRSGGDLSVGSVSVEDLDPAGQDALEGYMVVGLFPQVWDVDFTGELEQAKLIFHYDASALLGVDESSLVIWHFADGSWRMGGTVDEVAHTVSVTVDVLSPFALGVVPEPGTLSLLAWGGGCLFVCVWQRRRRR